MLAEIPIISPVFQFLLNTIGWVLAEIYHFIPNYGVSIIILTLLIRFILFPLGVKQIKSMQAMQAIGPRVKELQKKYKNDKQRAQAETMKLYKEAGVNPLGSCLPMLAQFPILISMYAVLRAPLLEATPVGPDKPVSYLVMNNHLPVDSELFQDVITHQHTSLLIVNMQCSAAQSGTQAVINDTAREPVIPGKPLINGTDDKPLLNDAGEPILSRATMDCGTGGASKIPYFVLLLFMVGTTFFQQRQMTKATPPGASTGSQQAILKFMPIMFGIFGFQFPAGLVLYWTTSNLFQIGQQALLLRAGHIGPEAMEKRMAERRAQLAAQPKEPEKKGFMARMMEQQQAAREGSGKKPADGKGKSGPSKGSGSSKPKGGAGSQGKVGQPPPPRKSGPRRKPNTGPKKRPGSGGNGGSPS